MKPEYPILHCQLERLADHGVRVLIDELKELRGEHLPGEQGLQVVQYLSEFFYPHTPRGRRRRFTPIHPREIGIVHVLTLKVGEPKDTALRQFFQELARMSGEQTAELRATSKAYTALNAWMRRITSRK